MPYYNNYKRKYRRYRKPRYYKKKGNRALVLAKKALSMINVEYKILDSTFSLAAVADSIGITQLTNLSQGDTTITRDGSQIKITSAYLTLAFKMNASATNTLIRCMLVHDKQTNQAIYVGADLLNDATVGGDNVMSPLNIDNKRRFHVLMDKVFSVSAGAQQTHFIKFYKKLNIPIRYDANVGDITDLTSSSLSLVTVSSEVTNDPTITGKVRLRFVDN